MSSHRGPTSDCTRSYSTSGTTPVRLERDDLHGTKVELALVGWVQLQSDQHTDRVNLDASDGYEDAALVRRFARLHDAGSLRAVFYPSVDELIDR